MTVELPERYPLANASDEEIDQWLAAERPPYEAMPAALPWLDQPYQFDAWIDGLRSARQSAMDVATFGADFPRLANLALPPRHVAGRAAR